MNNLLRSLPKLSVRTTLVICVLVGLITYLFYYFGAEIALVLVPMAGAAAIAYSLHLKSLAEKTREVTEAGRIHLATVEALATAIDARDQVGVGHVRRVQIYAVGIGKILGLNKPDIDALRTGALLHDIGKLAVPDHILNKPGSLTPAELEKTKIHSEVGASILEKVGFDNAVVPTVRYHHERWDGLGYPKGLKSDAIPLTARILSVADAFDTLRGARPYRLAIPRDKARQIIQSEAGTRFDPAIVSTLIRNLAALEAEIVEQGLAYSDLDNSNSHFVEQIKLANREVFSLYELAREFGSATDLQETLDLFSAKVRELVPFDTCAVYLLDNAKRIAAAAHVEGVNSDVIAHHAIMVGQGATGYALKSGERVQNVDPDLDFFYAQLDLDESYTTLASVPLIAAGETIGAVTLYSCELNEYGEEHIRLLETIARIAADAIDKSLEHDEARTNAMTDPMTGLPNARSLQAQFDKEVARADRNDASFQLVMLDLDGFKSVNDTFGHKAGDELLREVSKVIGGQLRDYDFLARYGGDEFVALVPETKPEDVADLCMRIEKAVAAFELPFSDGQTARVGVSPGSATYQRGRSFDQMIAGADKAMYVRKTFRKRTMQMPFESSVNGASGSSFIVELDESHVLAAVN
ncbi:MAG TPA: diguanylate cyclase [Pyrinomonadaceae bacterium]|jgi:diguanylate cyclase (GGDEF)-like protein/putative nucleotidyltransferase with HDIG domain|nr:diguanylate cyclase [Pyrinomonadaceae bacterium]